MTALGSDHAGYEMKLKLIRYFQDNGIKFYDFGCYTPEAADYPIYARQVCEAVESGRYVNGILLCGTGVGMSIAANRCGGIRAALCRDAHAAAMTREHNDANVLVLGARVTEYAQIIEITTAFFNTPFSNEERHVRRLSMLNTHLT